MTKKDQNQVLPLETPLGFLDHFKGNDELYHSLYPIAFGGRYKLEKTHLNTFQLLGLRHEIIPSGTLMNPGHDLIEESFQDRVHMNEAARIFCRNSFAEPIPDTEENILARTSGMARGLFQSIQRSRFFPFTFKQMGLKAMSQEEIGQKFASTLMRRDIDGYGQEELIHTDISTYLNPGVSKRFQEGTYYFWTEHLLDVFDDFGIIKVNPTFRYMVFLQFINNY